VGIGCAGDTFRVKRTCKKPHAQRGSSYNRAGEKFLPEIDESWLFPEATAEAPLRKFAPDEMLTCDSCLRANAPTRAQCLYCGASLQKSAASPEVEASADQETGEAKQYVVVWTRQVESINDSEVAQLAAKFHLNHEELRVAFRTGAPLPLTSTPSADEANRIISDLKSDGIESAVVSSGNLKTDIPHVNIRALEFADSNVIAISKIGRQRLAARLSDIQLVVTGRLLVHRIEVDERRSRSSVKPLDRREFTQDQSVVDVYPESADAPWRIIVNDFDFSCLGERKGLTAYDNVKALIELLKESTPAEVNDSYARVRPLLNDLWPLQDTASQGRSRRPRAGRHEFSTVTASDNEAQFNNYSRLVWYVKRANQQPLGENEPG
jgi:hypothetical protein